jgi:hypothetical protein
MPRGHGDGYGDGGVLYATGSPAAIYNRTYVLYAKVELRASIIYVELLYYVRTRVASRSICMYVAQ